MGIVERAWAPEPGALALHPAHPHFPGVLGSLASARLLHTELTTRSVSWSWDPGHPHTAL